MQWPNTIPPDLRERLGWVMGYRSYSEADIWAVFKEWLEHHEVQAVALPEDEHLPAKD